MKSISIYILLLSLSVAGCVSPSKQLPQTHNKSHSEHESRPDSGQNSHNAMQFAGLEHAVTQDSEQGLYKLTLYSNESPIPLQKIHSWSLHVEYVKGAPVDRLKIFVFGGMPMHRHGFPTKPRISDHQGTGNFRIDGIKYEYL